MKPSLQLKIGQHLTMTPQLQQAIRLLQLSTLDLQQEIQETVESNPMLDIQDPSDEANQDRGDNDPDDGIAASPTADERAQAADNDAASEEWNEQIPEDLPVDSNWDDVYQSMPAATPAGAAELPDFESQTSREESIHDHLLWQLNLTPMSDTDRIIAITLIDSVDNDGYLTTPLASVADQLNDILSQMDSGESSTLIEIEEVEAVLRRLQHFDPLGVFARDLGECLTLQLDQLAHDTPLLAKAKEVVANYLPQLGSRDFNQIMRRTRLKEGELQQVIQLIQSLNPRPGETLNSKEPEYVVPDVVVKKINGRWQVELNNDAMPKVNINATYASLVKRADNSSDNTYLRNQLQEARWFLKSLQSRNETLLKVSARIVEIQQGFLEHGEEAMKPLVLHDIADAVEMHESTISRVTTQKYIHTPRGIFELKYFFSSHVDTQSGTGCSSTAIRAIIKKLISAEKPVKPLSDSKIANILAEQGIKVARRTIAKYRESLSIPPSNERKRLV
ncbi:MAG: RNA polymerase factor sigma-54 [Pseudomonadales bacterium]|jgi:RNA polymerase sigma-54 factor